MEEKFKVLTGITENYAVSKSGKIKSLSRLVYDTGHDRYYKIKEKILKSYINNKGYECVDLRINNKTRKFLVHRLVAFAFIPNPNNYEVINHKDSNPLNNDVKNLEWCTTSYNIQYEWSFNDRKVSDNMMAQFKKPKLHLWKAIQQYDLSNKFLQEFKSMSEATKWLITKDLTSNPKANSNISACCNGKAKSAYGYIWKYKEEV